MKISAKMKLLSLAILGLGGMAMAGSAAAACPTDPTPVWSALNQGGGTSSVAIEATKGYDSTSCSLKSSLGNSGTARAQVRDDSPANEQRYRGQFIFDPSQLSGAGGTNQATVFFANTGTAVNGSLSALHIIYSGSGAGTKRLMFFAGCSNGTTGLCASQVDLPDQAGANRVEFDMQMGADGTANVRYWVSAVGTATSDASPTGTIAITGGNAAWGGVETAFLGLSAPTPQYRATNTDKVAWFDQFDSRRSSFIGQP